jgi:integrase
MESSKLKGSYVDPAAGKVTFKTYAEAWRKRQVHRPSTAAQVETYMRLHAYPMIGSRPLASLRPSDIQGLVTERLTALSAGSTILLYRYVASILKDAERDFVIGRSPCVGIKLPRITSEEIVPPTIEQVEAIADGIKDRYRGTVIVAAGAGLRLGEVLGLHVDRIDFLRRQIRVDQQLITLAGPPVLGPPKTPASVRTVPVADVVLTELSEHIRQFPPVDGFVFTTTNGRPIRRSTFGPAWQRALKNAKEAGVEDVRFHDLRHHFASALISAGCSIKAVQSALGHANASETLDTYSHLWPSDEDTTRAAIESVWNSPRATSVSRDVSEETA